MRNVLVLTMALIGLAACAEKDGDGRLREKAQIEQEGQSEVERKKIQERALKMEEDLADRHYFYNALEGEYIGTLNVEGEIYKIKFTYARSIPPYTGSRVRELSEIENDLNNLYFHMQVVQWHPDDPSSAVGCRVTGIKPNMDNGNFTVASSECPNLYAVFISNAQKSMKNRDKTAIEYAMKIKNKEIKKVDNIVGYVQPSSVSAKYAFAAQRTN